MASLSPKYQQQKLSSCLFYYGMPAHNGYPGYVSNIGITQSSNSTLNPNFAKKDRTKGTMYNCQMNIKLH